MYPPEYQHILDFLDSNPEYLQDMRARLLTPDLIALPEQFAQLVGLVTELSASFHDFAAATDRRLEALDGHAADTNRRLTSLETSVASLTGSDLENRARHNILPGKDGGDGAPGTEAKRGGARKLKAALCHARRRIPGRRPTGRSWFQEFAGP